MKIQIKYIITNLILFIPFYFVLAQNKTIRGYKIIDDTVIFTFNKKDYQNLSSEQNINNVYVAGSFNNWSKDQWKMTKVNDSIFELHKKLDHFNNKFEWEFKFVVDGKYWAEPNDNFENIKKAKDKFGFPLMSYNLKMHTAFPSDNGNITFKLKGFRNAKAVILSGSFNRWDEQSFKMKKTKTGWTLTLQLRPNIYQYKFIVDGHWIEDPDNPQKELNEFNGYNSVINIQEIVHFELLNHLDANTVILSGSFNNWSEDEFVMTKTTKGWEYPVRLSGGKHHYKFIVDGHWITDPYNSVVEYDGHGNINSVCIVK